MGSYNNKHININSFFTNHVQTLKLIGGVLNDHELQNNTQYYKKISNMHHKEMWSQSLCIPLILKWIGPIPL